MALLKSIFAVATGLLILTTIVLGLSAIAAPTGYSVECDSTSFTLPAGTFENAVKATEGHEGCKVEKIKF